MEDDGGYRFEKWSSNYSDLSYAYMQANSSDGEWLVAHMNPRTCLDQWPHNECQCSYC